MKTVKWQLLHVTLIISLYNLPLDKNVVSLYSLCYLQATFFFYKKNCFVITIAQGSWLRLL